jgi:hypothetical protein
MRVILSPSAEIFIGSRAAPGHFDEPPTDPSSRFAGLERKCRALCARGLAGHGTNDLALHRNLLSILEAERAVLAATESLPTSPDRRRLRAA